jgi:hypothetical protein
MILPITHALECPLISLHFVAAQSVYISRSTHVKLGPVKLLLSRRAKPSVFVDRPHR